MGWNVSLVLMVVVSGFGSTIGDLEGGDAPASGEATGDDFLGLFRAFAQCPRLLFPRDLPVRIDDFLESVHCCDVGCTTGNPGIKKAPSMIG